MFIVMRASAIILVQRSPLKQTWGGSQIIWVAQAVPAAPLLTALCAHLYLYVYTMCIVMVATLFVSLYSRMPSWVQPMIPRILYITEKGWNFYPYTKTGNTHQF